MARINLLPWREELRKQQQQDFLTAIGAGCLVVCLIMLLVHTQISGKIEYQQQRNQFLEQEVAALDKKIAEIKELETKKNRLISKMEVIQQLQGSRPESVHLLDELAKTVPDGVKLDAITQDGRSLSIKGVAQSNARVSAYMRNFETSSWLSTPVLSVIENKGGKTSTGETPYQFEMKVQQSSQSSTKPTSGG